MTLVVIPTLTKEGAVRAEKLVVTAQRVCMDALVIDNGGHVADLVMLPSVVAARQPSVAASWNYALRERRYVTALILNDDIELDADGLLELWLHAELSLARWRSGRGPKELIAAEPHPFAAFAMHGLLLETVGYFDEQFIPAYYEDTDYLIRMERAGVALRTVDVGVKHTPATTAKELGTTWQKIAAESKAKFEAKWGKQKPYFTWPYDKKPDGAP